MTFSIAPHDYRRASHSNHVTHSLVCERASFSPQKRVVNKPRISDPFRSTLRVPSPISIEFPQYDLEYPFTYYNDERHCFQKLDDAQTI
jgi:hypothetical protein